jgi:transposase
MSRKKRFIEKLTKEEKSSLAKGYKTGKSHLTRRKCQAILLSHGGTTAGELSTLYSVTIRTVYSWFNSWESNGIKGLELKPGRGRKAKLQADDKDQVKIIKTLVENEPQSLKQVVKKIKSTLGIDLSKKTLKRFLKKNLSIDGNDSENE